MLRKACLLENFNQKWIQYAFPLLPSLITSIIFALIDPFSAGETR